MGTPAFRFCLDNTTLTQACSVRYYYLLTIYSMTSLSCLRIYGQLLCIIVSPTVFSFMISESSIRKLHRSYILFCRHRFCYRRVYRFLTSCRQADSAAALPCLQASGLPLRQESSSHDSGKHFQLSFLPEEMHLPASSAFSGSSHPRLGWICWSSWQGVMNGRSAFSHRLRYR